jgi:sugar/nucleoside kinase (ribokinase family)
LISISGIVLCAGNLTQDILACPVDGITFNSTAWVEQIENSIGGNGANTAHALATLGARVRLIGAAGADKFGDHAVSTLASAGVDVTHIERVDAATATTVVLVNRHGERAFLHRPGASRHAFTSTFDFSSACVHGCSHFHLANPFALPALRDRAGEMLRDARSAGLTTSLDTGWDARGEWMKVIGPCLPHIDLLFANDAEAEKLTGSPHIHRAARFFREHGAGAVVLKLGRQGCVVFDGDEEISACAFAVDVVDTTGAGDCFVGGFLAALQRGGDASEAARIGNIAGALAVQRIGSVAGLAPYEEVVQWAESHRV